MADIEEHQAYAILYEDKDEGFEECEFHIYKSDINLGNFIQMAKDMRDEGHRNVRVVEYVTVMREIERV